MNKVGILFDSSCGFSKEKIEKDGNYFIPIIIEIAGQEYQSGIDLNNEILFEKFKTHKEPYKTSSVRMIDFEEQLNKALEENEKVIVLAISKGISSTTEHLAHFVKQNDKYKDRVIVFDSNYITPWTMFIYDDLMALKNYENVNVEMVIKMLDFYNNIQQGYVAPDNLERLRIGGRLNEVQYRLAKVLKIQPIIEVIGGGLNNGRTFKVRKFEKAIKKMVDEVAKDWKRIEEKDNGSGVKVLYLIHGNDQAKDLMFDYAKEIGLYIHGETTLSPAINCHLGEKAFGIGAVETKPWKYFIK